MQAEGKNSDCDIFYDLEVVNAEIILNASPGFVLLVPSIISFVFDLIFKDQSSEKQDRLIKAGVFNQRCQ